MWEFFHVGLSSTIRGVSGGGAQYANPVEGHVIEKLKMEGIAITGTGSIA